MKWLRISKFDPSLRDISGNYLQDDWTSVSDIGKIFNDCHLVEGEYLLYENKYINTIIEWLDIININELKLVRFHKTRSISIESNKTLYSNGLLSYYDKLNKKSVVNKHDFDKLIRLILREDIYCALADKNRRIYIDFGYDFYMFIRAPKALINGLRSICSKNGLFSELLEINFGFEM